MQTKLAEAMRIFRDPGQPKVTSEAFGETFGLEARLSYAATAFVAGYSDVVAGSGQGTFVDAAETTVRNFTGASPEYGLVVSGQMERELLEARRAPYGPGVIEHLRTKRIELEHRARQLEIELKQAKRHCDLLVADALGDEDTLFVLWELVRADGLTLDELSKNLEAPWGWVKLCSLWRADLIRLQGDSFLPTELARELVERLLGKEIPQGISRSDEHHRP